MDAKTNDPTNWKARLRGEKVIAHPDDPDYGFYRERTRDGSWRWITYWFTAEGELKSAHQTYGALDEHRARELWQFVCVNPITTELYKLVKAGGEWPDINPVVLRQRKLLSNRPPEDDSFEALKELFDELERDAKALMKQGAATNDDAADSAGNLAKWMGQLATRAEAVRKREKAPHIAAGREVDEKWRPITDSELYKQIKQTVVKPWLDVVEADRAKREAEARAKAAKALREAEEKAAAEAEARKVAEEAKRSGDLMAALRAESEAEAAAEAAEAAAATANSAAAQVREIADESVTAGTRGGGVHLRTEYGYEYTNRSEALAYFADSEEISKALDTVVKRAVKAKLPVPGVKVTRGTKAA